MDLDVTREHYPASLAPAPKESERVRPSDVWVSELSADERGVQLYRQGLLQISEYSRGPSAGRLLRVDPNDVAPDDLRRSLAWLYSQLALQRAHYAGGEAAPELDLADDQRRRVAWHSLCALRARGIACNPLHPELRWRVQLSEEGTLLLPSDCREPRLQVVLEGYLGAYRFEWRPESSGIPSQIELVSRRRGRRARVSTRVRARAERLPGGELLVRDVSQRGIAVACVASEQMIFPGQHIEGLTIHWKGGVAIECSATVAHVAPRAASGLDLCGLLLEFSPEQRRRWRDLVEPLLHPRTVLGNVPSRTLLSAYRGSGYLSLSGKNPQDFREQQQRFRDAQALLSKAPAVGACVGAGQSGRMEAFCHQLQFWSGSWLFYHLCRLPNGRTLETSDDLVLVDLYARAYDYIQNQPDCRWLVTFIQKEAGYSHRVHYQGALEFAQVGGAGIVTVSVHEVDCHTASSLQPPNVELASYADAEQVRSKLAARFPAEYLHGTGLSEPGLGLEELGALWRQHALQRERRVVVIKRGAEVLAAGVFEAATPGLHLYGLLDCARIFVFDRQAVGLTADLLDAAVVWFKSLGRTKFCYFRDVENPEGLEHLTTRNLGEAYVIVQTSAHIPLLLERVFSLAAPTLTPFSEPAPSPLPSEVAPRALGG